MKLNYIYWEVIPTKWGWSLSVDHQSIVLHFLDAVWSASDPLLGLGRMSRCSLGIPHGLSSCRALLIFAFFDNNLALEAWALSATEFFGADDAAHGISDDDGLETTVISFFIIGICSWACWLDLEHISKRSHCSCFCVRARYSYVDSVAGIFAILRWSSFRHADSLGWIIDKDCCSWS